MLIKMTAKEVAALALALQERPEKSWDDLAQAMKKLNGKAQNHEKIVPPDTKSRNGFSVGDLVICGALDERAGAGTVLEVTDFCFGEAVVSDGKRSFLIPVYELRRVAAGAHLDVKSFKEVPW